MYYSSLLVISVTLLLSSAASAQEVITISNAAQAPQEISANHETVTLVSKNHLSNTITVHTYKLNYTAATSAQDNDANPSGPSSEITTIINSFSAITGVSECTFDRATQTFTIVSSPTTNLTVAVDTINHI
jgi:hypothetical protein